MHTGQSYKLTEFLVWTKQNIFRLVVIGCIPVILYEVSDLKWLALPWTVIALLGTATAFIIGFKNQQTYNRTWEARQIWGACISNSRSWAVMCLDFIEDRDRAKELIYRHLAWITALRYQLRVQKDWENQTKPYNREYRKFYSIPEHEIPLQDELSKYIDPETLKQMLTTQNKAVQLMRLQGDSVKQLYATGQLDALKFSDMHKAVRDFFDHQGRCERIKNFPYPRQYATISSFFVRLFSLMLPLGMLGEFDRLNHTMTGILQGHMVWLVIPFSVMISWVYTSLEQVGESTENPFEGAANDVPLAQMSRAVEIDILEMLGETELPEPLQAKNNIIL